MNSEAYELGYIAYISGFDLESNPFDDIFNESDYKDWIAGWHSASE